MCGIFGGNNGADYTGLYELNKERGDFSFGAYSMGTVWKSTEPIKFCLEVSAESGKFGFHTRAPTSLTSGFVEEDSHPFKYGIYVVGHNGIIDNHEDLRTKFKLSGLSSVDSAIIPALIEKFRSEGNDEVQSISKCLSELKGTFGLWILNEVTNTMHLARSSSTLYIQNPIPGVITFSSYPQNKEHDILLDEGVIYELSTTLKCVGTFEHKTPFFVL